MSISMANIHLKGIAVANVFREAPGVNNGEGILGQSNNAEDNTLEVVGDTVQIADKMCESIDTIYDTLA